MIIVQLKKIQTMDPFELSRRISSGQIKFHLPEKSNPEFRLDNLRNIEKPQNTIINTDANIKPNINSQIITSNMAVASMFLGLTPKQWGKAGLWILVIGGLSYIGYRIYKYYDEKEQNKSQF